MAKGVEIIVIGTCGAVTAKNFYLTDWQLELGPVATDFEFRPFAAELLLCQRYFRYLNPGATGSVYTANYVWVGCTFPEMRIPPTPTLRTSPPQFRINGATTVTGSGSVLTDTSIERMGGYISFSGFTGLTPHDCVSLMTATAVTLDAEL